MDIQRILNEYDSMFGKCELTEIDAFLTTKIEEAYGEKDYYSAVTLLNEMMGFCRDTSQNEKGIAYCKQMVDLIEQMGLKGTVEYATSLLNVANAYRAFGLFEESMHLYEMVETIYHEKLERTHFHYASLYNNWSLLYQELERFAEAVEQLKKAMVVVDAHEEALIEQATTRANLAVSLLRLYQEKCDEAFYDEAMIYIQEALAIHERDGGGNFHYSAVLSAAGDACFMKEKYEEAASYYKKAMTEQYRHTGDTDAYKRICANYEVALKMAGKECVYQNHIEKCRVFYLEQGKPMLENQFGEYLSQIAVGLVGEGSDCFGFEDDISKDHDFGIGFCMWLSDAVYEKIGEDLQAAYDNLIAQYDTENASPLYQKRRGVFLTRDFYAELLGSDFTKDLLADRLTEAQWLAIPEDMLATATNGTVFEDTLGEFTELRKRLLAYYPESVWKQRLAKALHEFSQYGQSNYGRMMARKDYVTAGLCVRKTVESAMDIAYLLNKSYAPYYKWKRKGLTKLQRLQELDALLEELVLLPCQKEAWIDYNYTAQKINTEDGIIKLIEAVATVILQEMKHQGLVTGDNPFLELYSKEFMMEENREQIIEDIVALEWEQFDKVKNEGGRADCQDDWNTFSIMRKSQYMAWETPLLNSYLADLINANKQGWNLIMEKYARMMESTTPEKYESLKQELPVRSPERIAIQEEIIRIQVAWMEEFAKQYPKMAGNARSIHTYEDNPYNTSYETYLRGELGTYSEETFVLYGRFVIALSKQGENLAYNIMDNTAKLYGYVSVEDAEARL